MSGEKKRLKNRLTHTHVYYVPFFDLKVAISDIIFTAHNLLIYQKRALECQIVTLSGEPH
jgi:hypothetical protein